MKYIIVILFLFICLGLSAQKMHFTYCKLLDNEGEILKIWKVKSFVHWYGDFATVETFDQEILNMISPSAIGDPSNFRVYIRTTDIEYLNKRGGGYYRRTKFKSISSDFEFDILAENSNGFFMFAINPSVALVMDNLYEKPKKKR